MLNCDAIGSYNSRTEVGNFKSAKGPRVVTNPPRAGFNNFNYTLMSIQINKVQILDD